MGQVSLCSLMCVVPISYGKFAIRTDLTCCPYTDWPTTNLYNRAWAPPQPFRVRLRVTCPWSGYVLRDRGAVTYPCTIQQSTLLGQLDPPDIKVWHKWPPKWAFFHVRFFGNFQNSRDIGRKWKFSCLVSVILRLLRESRCKTKKTRPKTVKNEELCEFFVVFQNTIRFTLISYRKKVKKARLKKYGGHKFWKGPFFYYRGSRPI